MQRFRTGMAIRTSGSKHEAASCLSTGLSRPGSVALALLAGALLAACGSPASRFDTRAGELGFARQSVQGTGFTHTLFSNRALRSGRYLHVYLDGDGTPWIHHSEVAQDPTPRNAMVLQWMHLDPAEALYLGRPCYHGQSAASACSPGLWTGRRYGPAVVDSMAAALEVVTAEAENDGLVFIGYSGGGTLAMLLAERFENTRAVLTVAANLDPDAWAQLHRYSPLGGSLNPARRPPLPERILQIHYAGGEDTNVPPALATAAVARQFRARLVVIDSFDHECCWTEHWRSILGELQASLYTSGDYTQR